MNKLQTLFGCLDIHIYSPVQKKITILSIVHIFKKRSAYWGIFRLMYSWGDTKKRMLRKMSINTYSHTSYLPIFDRSKMECSSLMRMRRNKFCIVQKNPLCRNL